MNVSGFAAGCEARLCLAVADLAVMGLCPWFGLWPKTMGTAGTGGEAASEGVNGDGEAKPRRTSGGEAAANRRF